MDLRGTSTNPRGSKESAIYGKSSFRWISWRHIHVASTWCDDIASLVDDNFASMPIFAQF